MTVKVYKSDWHLSKKLLEAEGWWVGGRKETAGRAAADRLVKRKANCFQ